MKKALTMMLIRLGDLVTTIIGITKYDIGIEGNPFVRYLLSKSYLGYIMISFGVSVLLSIAIFRIKKKFIQTVFTIFMIFNGLVVCNNFICCFM